MATPLKGVIRLDPPPGNIEGAKVRVRLLDTTYADAPAHETAATTVHGVDDATASNGIPFALDVPETDPRKSYELSVHVDMNGSGNIEPGDYLTMESYPVSTAEPSPGVSVTARRVE